MEGYFELIVEEAATLPLLRPPEKYSKQIVKILIKNRPANSKTIAIYLLNKNNFPFRKLRFFVYKKAVSPFSWKLKYGCF